MKTFTVALLATVAACAASSLRAETRVHLGVRLGGPECRPVAPVVVYAPPPAVVYAPAPGYWNEVVVKTWIPERWVFSRDRWGRGVRICEPGYYTYRTDRVWIDSRDRRHPGDHHTNRAFGHWGR